LSSGARGAAPEHDSKVDRQDMLWLEELGVPSSRVRARLRRAARGRSLLTQEGICLTLQPDFRFLEVAYPYVARRLLTDEDPALRERLFQARHAASSPRGCPVFAARLSRFCSAADRTGFAARPSCVKVLLLMCEERACRAAGGLHECARTEAPPRLLAHAVA